MFIDGIKTVVENVILLKLVGKVDYTTFHIHNLTSSIEALFIFIHQTGSKMSNCSIFKKQHIKLNYKNLTKYYKLLQNLHKSFTVEYTEIYTYPALCTDSKTGL